LRERDAWRDAEDGGRELVGLVVVIGRDDPRQELDTAVQVRRRRNELEYGGQSFVHGKQIEDMPELLHDAPRERMRDGFRLLVHVERTP
jgi:hypothetical protein